MKRGGQGGDDFRPTRAPAQEKGGGQTDVRIPVLQGRRESGEGVRNDSCQGPFGRLANVLVLIPEGPDQGGDGAPGVGAEGARPPPCPGEP